MPIGIIRFGGNSFSNKNHLNIFVDEIQKSTQRRVVVVSAIPKIIEILRNGLFSIINRGADFNDIIQKVIVEIESIGIADSIEEELSKEISQLEGLLQGIQYTGDYSEALRDVVISFSEKITVQVLAGFLKQKSIDSAVFYPEEIGFLVTEEFGNASVLTAENSKIRDLPFQKINLIPGSYGISRSKKIVRLGNQAADYTASALANTLGADCVELWKSSHSFRTADASIVSNSAVISHLSYEEASELSYFSHSALHPRIVEPLSAEHIPIRVFRFSFSGIELETIINSKTLVSENVVKSIVSTDEIAILKLNGPGVGYKPGILAKVTSAFHRAEINIRSVITSQVSINIILERADAAHAATMCDSLQLSTVSELIIDDKVTLVAVVGHGMQSHHGVSAKLFTAVADKQINVLLSGSGASDLVSYLVINQDEKKKAICAIHDAFMS